MISFFKTPSNSIIAVETGKTFTPETLRKLKWLFGEAELLDTDIIEKQYVRPRREMITPWSTCAVEISSNMGIDGITRIEEYTPFSDNGDSYFYLMLQRIYKKLDQSVFTIVKKPEVIIYNDNIEDY